MLGRIIFLLLLFGSQVSYSACEESGMYCSIGKQTRDINGMQVTRDCWQYKYKMNCESESKNDCGKYTEEREELLKNEQPADPKDLLCNMMCLDSECDAVKKAADEVDSDMGQAAAMLNALKEAKNSIDGDKLINIFKGSTESCKDKAIAYTNCCTDLGGWGEILGASCGPEDENLAKKRAQKKCEFVGRYCSQRFLGICVAKTNSYCCFDSIIGKIITLEAKKQLGRSNGTAELPTCGGLTLEDFQRVDMSKADFSEFYQNVVIPNIKIPSVLDDAKANSDAAEEIAKAAKGMPNDKKGFNPNVGGGM